MWLPIEMGWEWEFGVNRCKVLPLNRISNGILLDSTGKYVLSLEIDHDNVRKKNVHTYVCVQEGTHICLTGSPCYAVEI